MNSKYVYHDDGIISNQELPLLYDLLLKYQNTYWLDTDCSDAIDEVRSLIEKRYLQNTGLKIREAPGNPKNAGRKSSLTETQINEIIDLYKSGMTQSKIAAKYGISRSRIQQILSVYRFGTRNRSYYLEHM